MIFQTPIINFVFVILTLTVGAILGLILVYVLYKICKFIFNLIRTDCRSNNTKGKG